jgi:hypothetical protein
MNKTLVVFAALLIFTNVYAENTNENVGAWSEAVNGLRGRLIVTQEKEVNGVQSPKVFLELQNVANILNPIQIDAFNPESSFRCRLMDGAGKIIRSSPIGIREVGMPSFPLTIPFESSLQLNVNRHAMGAWFFGQVPPKQRTQIVLGDGVWVVEEESRADYFLDGTFQIEESKPVLFPKWSGTLKIPGVKIPRLKTD